MHKEKGFVLAFVLLLMMFMVVLLYGLVALTQIGQADVGGKKDLLLAKQYAQNAIFDTNTGATTQILLFESQLVSGQYLELTTATNRESSISPYFTNNCTNIHSLPEFTKGLCSSPESSATSNYSVAWLRTGTVGTATNTVTPPCATYSRTSITSASDLPLLDDKTSRYSFSYTTSNTNLCAQPRFIIELINPNFAIWPLVSGARLYRVTSRAFGISGNSIATQQAYFYVRCTQLYPSTLGSCYISLLSSNALY